MAIHEFHDQFSWALPYAFNDCIRDCYFEAGDCLFDTKLAYQHQTWGENLKHINYGIHVTSPKRGGARQSANESDVFKKNWASEVGLELIHYGDRGQIEDFVTTQGRLFSLLISGDLSLLSKDTPEPALPWLIDDAIKSEYLEKVIELAKKDFGGEHDNYFVFPFDLTNQNYFSKTKRAEEVLKKDGFEVREKEYTLEQCGKENYRKFNPVICYKVFIVEAKKIEEVRDCFKKALYPTTDRESIFALETFLTRTKAWGGSRFKLANHGLFVPYIEKNHGDIWTHSFAKHTTFFR